MYSGVGYGFACKIACKLAQSQRPAALRSFVREDGKEGDWNGDL